MVAKAVSFRRISLGFVPMWSERQSTYWKSVVGLSHRVPHKDIASAVLGWFSRKDSTKARSLRSTAPAVDPESSTAKYLRHCKNGAYWMCLSVAEGWIFQLAILRLLWEMPSCSQVRSLGGNEERLKLCRELFWEVSNWRWAARSAAYASSYMIVDLAWLWR